jgi:tryptophan synthase beta subunit
MTGNLPDVVEACVGGGSNAIGIFTGFLDDPVELIGVEPLGRGEAVGERAATMTYGREGIVPALESAHAVAHALVKARGMKTGTILVNLSGRGDKDMDYVIEHWGIGDGEDA